MLPSSSSSGTSSCLLRYSSSKKCSRTYLSSRKKYTRVRGVAKRQNEDNLERRAAAHAQRGKQEEIHSVFTPWRSALAFVVTSSSVGVSPWLQTPSLPAARRSFKNTTKTGPNSFNSLRVLSTFALVSLRATKHRPEPPAHWAVARGPCASSPEIGPHDRIFPRTRKRTEKKTAPRNVSRSSVFASPRNDDNTRVYLIIAREVYTHPSSAPDA